MDRVRVWLTGVMVAVAALTVLGMIAMWPRGEAPDLGDLPARSYKGDTIGFEVLATDVEVPTEAWF